MSSPAGESIPSPENGFPERILLNEYEERLYAIQEEADVLGLEAAHDIMYGLESTHAVAGLHHLAELANRILSQAGFLYSDRQFSARYIYKKPQDEKRDMAELVYPADSLHHSAYVEGAFGLVRPVLVRHPDIERHGLLGFRLCAEVMATRVMGMTTGEPRAFYIPAGEIYLEDVTYDHGMRQTLEPKGRPTYL